MKKLEEKIISYFGMTGLLGMIASMMIAAYNGGQEVIGATNNSWFATSWHNAYGFFLSALIFFATIIASKYSEQYEIQTQQ
ncbi:MAG: hypothetical protein WCJ81_00050 [bacterium]